MINPNTSATITEILANRMREIEGRGGTILPVTGRFGASYIASSAAAAIAGHAALDALAEHVSDCDMVYLACFGGPTAFAGTDSRWQAALWQFDICRSGGVRVSQIAPTL